MPRLYDHDSAMHDLEGIALKETHTEQGRYERMEEYRRLRSYIAHLEEKRPIADAAAVELDA